MKNNKLSLRIACSTVALICAAAAAPAWAQDQVQAEGDAVADAQPLSSSQTVDDVAAEEDVVITGTSISGVKPVGNEVIVITAEDAVKTGYSTPVEVLRTLPQVRLGEYDSDGGRSTISPQNSVGASTISLRPISSQGNSNQTLILVDGRRQVSGGTNQTYMEANQVPLAALQRIEVVTDGASAVYGSDAAGGVINYVLRKDYEGGEFRIRANNNSGGLEYGLDATLGTNWTLGGLGAGNILVSYGYTKRDRYVRGKNDYFRSDLRPLGGLDGRAVDGNPTLGTVPAIVVETDGAPRNPVFPRAGEFTYYGLPTGVNVGVTAGQLGVNQVDLIDTADFIDYNGRMRRHQVNVNIKQELGDSVELYVQGSFSDRETRTRNLSSVNSVQLRPFLLNAAGGTTTTPNPNYIFNVPGVSQGTPAGFQFVPFPPFIIAVPAQPAAPLRVVLPQLGDYGPRDFLGSDRSYNVTVGARLELPYNWKGDVFYTLGRNEGCTFCVINDTDINIAALQYQVDLGNINPLSTLPLTAAQRATFLGTQKQIGHNGIDNIAARFNGPLFSLPGGTVRAAVGFERIQNFAWNENTARSGALNTPTVITDRNNSYLKETTTSFFGELYVPVIDDDMDVPLFDSLLLSAAARYDKYSYTGVDSLTPKFGFDWKVADFFSLRGSWSKSFRAPSISDLNPNAYVSGFITPYLAIGYNADPALDNRDLRYNCTPAFGACFANFGLIFGANPSLKPETATNWTLTGELSPGAGFKISASYFNIKYKNRISFPGVFGDILTGPITGGLNPVYPLGFGDFIIPINNPATCVNSDLSTADPVLQSYLQGPVYSISGGLSQLGGLADFCSIDAIGDSRFTNLARTFTDGMDINVSFNRDLGGVFLSSGATVNVIFNNSVQPVAGGVTADRTGKVDGPVKWRGRGNVGLSKDGFNAILFGNYYHSFLHDQNISQPIGDRAPNVKIPSYTTFDLTLGYSTDFEGRSAGFLKGLRGSFTINNLANELPPLVRKTNSVTLEGHGLPFGRRFSLTLTGAF